MWSSLPIRLRSLGATFRLGSLLGVVTTCVCAAFVTTSPNIRAATDPTDWRPLFNGRDLDGWDTWLGADIGGLAEPSATNLVPLGLNHDPQGVFAVVPDGGRGILRVSGKVFGALTSRDSFDSFHLRVAFRWGGGRVAPDRESPSLHRSGIRYRCRGPQGAVGMAWMHAIACDLLEGRSGGWHGGGGAGGGASCDVTGRRLLAASPGQATIAWDPLGDFMTASPVDRITPGPAPDVPPDGWTIAEVISWNGYALHVMNGQLVLALARPRLRDGSREIPPSRGPIQLLSAGSETFFRSIDLRPTDGIPAEWHASVPPAAPDETGFVPLFGRDARDGWAQCGPGGFTVSNGVAAAFGGMGLWWHSRRMFTNFVLRGEWQQESPLADSGVFVRFPDPGNDPWNAVRSGHEMEIGDDPDRKDPTWQTGALYPFRAPSGVPVRPLGEWNMYELTCDGHDYAVRINGRLVTTWSDPTRRTAHGYIGLQNYEEGKNARHRNLRIKALP